MTKKRQWVGVTILVALCGVALVPGAGDGAMVKLGVGQLTAQADTIVLGTVASRVSAWNAQHTAIHTDVTVTIEEVVKGSPAAQVTFRVAGGVVGDVGMRTSTDPVFRDGERVIVFLSTGGASAQVVGMRQGKLTVTDNSVTVDGQTATVTDLFNAIRAVRP